MHESNQHLGRIGVRDITLTAQFVSIIVICSWITIPSAVPFTMQTFAIFLTVGMVGGKRGTLAVAVYLLLGAVGLPVFSGFNGGLAWMLGATGGYIIGFLFAALAMWAVELFAGNSMKATAAAMVLGLLVCYIFGTVWFALVYTSESGSMGLMTIIGMCVVPFIIPDCLKIVLACLMVRRLRPLLNNHLNL